MLLNLVRFFFVFSGAGEWMRTQPSSLRLNRYMRSDLVNLTNQRFVCPAYEYYTGDTTEYLYSSDSESSGLSEQSSESEKEEVERNSGYAQ